jgi:hypothetical protein
MALQIRNLMIELIGGCGKDSGIEEIFLGISDAMIIQDQKGISRRKLRGQESSAAPEQSARQQLALSAEIHIACHNYLMIAGSAIIDPAQLQCEYAAEKQSQVPFGYAQGGLSTPLRSAQDERFVETQSFHAGSI